jgi:hypothetical protein
MGKKGIHSQVRGHEKTQSFLKTGFMENFRAGDGIRTHDLLLGKETFYH